ncbi:RagB/SusD family nutrient uptake outer membrane protein [Chitinophaga horti]|uniref:RagB/SusD family nutrient uptake outer membrane protein n=1 Tax=Chitinophaga horti TaxID=2920382 RepID=A0ABY6IZ60_9BACT|nr:RagB/SusD family nutrient uptake outer membrane protein [Chitinophaga horti]UYQ92660.1 RagB/SusD family nutrient uptake outer membrane protein [Chitinophaga horti]
MRKSFLYSCMMLALLLGSCKKWIDVQPSDRLAEDKLFSTREGYLTSLNGVYAELTSPTIYGEQMTTSVVDVMAQYYFMTSSTHRFYDFTTFNYATDRSRTAFDNIWKKSYELIINCNVIIERCGDGTPVLPAPYFGLVKGEALALRAMLHFDMLRLFGPIWSETNKTVPCIPFNSSARPQASVLVSSDVVMQKVIEDLTQAAALLKDADPIITEGVRHGANPNGTNELYYRQYRLNYYAVKALLARAHLWKQDKENALREAQEVLTAVLDPAKTIFPIGITNPSATPADFDHMIRNEVMFALYKVNRNTVYTNFFTPDLQKDQRLSFNNNDANESRKNALYDDQNDYRLKAWMSLSNPNGAFLTHIKFSVASNTPAPNMMPLIRLSELLLIAAECTPTLEEGTRYLNILRTGRNCVSLTPATPVLLKDFITREFRKEVFGEGQMFFYYKRNAMTAIPNHAHLTNTKQMIPGNYTVPLPLSETAVRGN